jgi:hypothetical protein
MTDLWVMQSLSPSKKGVSVMMKRLVCLENKRGLRARNMRGEPTRIIAL